MIDVQRLELIRNRCGFENGLCLSSVGKSGGMGFWWRDVNVKLCFYSTHHLAADICSEDNNTIWTAVDIYGWPEAKNKHNTWELMRNICLSCSSPILMFGDFNEIVGMHEKEGGAFRRDKHCDAFREAIYERGCYDLGYKGNIFTW